MSPSRASIFVCALIVALSASDLAFAACTNGEQENRRRPPLNERLLYPINFVLS